MSKFKVGDKVRIVFGDGWIIWVSEMRAFIGKIVTISDVSNESRHPWFKIAGHPYHWNECDAQPIEPAREFIVLRRDGQNVIASHKRGDEIVKTAKATCNASDTFVFETGATLAFDRLMGREEAKPAPAPKAELYTGKVVCISGEYTVGKIYVVENGFFVQRDMNCPTKPYASVEDMNNRFLFGKFAEVKD